MSRPCVVLTGASGYLGQHVLHSLRQRGCDVVVLGRTAPVGFEDVPLIRTDLLDAASIEAAVKTVGVTKGTHLLHLAWYADYGKFWASPLNFRWVDASLRLIEAFCEQGGKHVVMAGSCAEYDWADGYLREGATPFTPQTTYGVAKDATRRLATALCALHGTTLAWGHIFFPFGPGEAPQRMIPSLIDVFQGRKAPFGVNASAYRGMLYVPDAAEAFAQLTLTESAGNFNICSGQPEKIEHVVLTLARLCGADPEPVLKLASARAGDPPMLVGQNTRLLATGWKPSFSLEQGLAAMVKAKLTPIT